MLNRLPRLAFWLLLLGALVLLANWLHGAVMGKASQANPFG